ncbi:hypothetical protein G9U51_12005 [Calidifontibacter sp. DB0510]|uniref:Uncharacterized protein n=1 Tax=Metallococcus carri TaxID=1656884 RepID=A0A967B6J5_9MICO|nr:hypothetical protein [Metallococcus carri]NOP36126.1 hypothetical protein [Calidifontibacter sp. DB2511S]
MTDILLAARQAVPTEELRDRWAADSVVWAIIADPETPVPQANRDQPSDARPPQPTAATTARWRPKHLTALRRPRSGN